MLSNLTILNKDKPDPKSMHQVDENDSNHMVLSPDDQGLKTLGEIFGNDTSRKIITALIKDELTASQISEMFGLKLNLVKYHLDKMLSLEIISIKKTTKNTRGHQVKHYRAKQAVMIFSKEVKNKAEKSKMFSDIIKRVTKFSAIGIAGVFTWVATSVASQGGKITSSIDTALKYPRPTLPPYMNQIEPQSAPNEIIFPIIVTAVVIASLLTIDRVVTIRTK